LGISAFYHDSAAAIVRDGQILAAAQEERFSRRKNDDRFPSRAVQSCLQTAGLRIQDVTSVVFHEKPIPKLTRSLETFLTTAPRGFSTFLRTLPNWLSERLDIRKTLRDELPGLPPESEILATSHHQAHAASAFFPSPFDHAAILTIDGVGEWATTTLSTGTPAGITPLLELRFPHSLGLLYSAFTAYCGFRVNSGEYKLMGLAPYGQPIYAQTIRDQLIDLKEDGSFRLNLEFFDFLVGSRMTNDRFHNLFGGPPRLPEDPVLDRHMDLARSVQEVTEEIVIRLARHARDVTGQDNLCLAGGVALNCVANGHILREGIFKQLWIQPAAGDAGAALGAALAAWHEYSSPRQTLPKANTPPHNTLQVKSADGMNGAFLGPEFSDAAIARVLDSHRAVYRQLPEKELLADTANLLAEGHVLGWFQGRMEFGPRALGNRSILADPRSVEMQSKLNLKIKFRESFRPFAPMVKAEHASRFFDLSAPSPYMLLVAPVREELRKPAPNNLTGFARLKFPNSTLPAITHVDYSARVQTVTPESNRLAYALLDAFEQSTGLPMLVNTSFNVRGEPVVGSPDDAYRCLINTKMDGLVIGSFLLKREDQPHASLPASHEPVPD